MSTLTEVREPESRETTPHQVAFPITPAPKPVYPMLFADVLLEVDGSERRRRRLAAFSSVTVQSLIIAILLVIPLMFTEALPKQQLLTFLVAPTPPPPPPPPAAPAVQVVRTIQSDLMGGRLRTPSRIPTKVQMIREEEAPPEINSGGGVVGGVPGGIPGGQLGGVIGGIISSTGLGVPKLALPVAPKRVRVSQGITSGMLLHRVEPKYPKIAQGARIQGQVVLTAIISKAGDVQNVTLISGHPMLVPAALEAVRLWQYRPYMLNGEPVEVETTITVTFRFAE